MPEKTPITIIPLRRSQEEILFSDGTREIRCYSPANPHYYKDGRGIFHAIDMASVTDAASKIGASKLRSANVVSAGVRSDGGLSKAVGLRPDFSQAKGTHQLEFSLVSVTVDGVAQDIDDTVTPPVISAKNPLAWDMGRYRVITNRRWCRQAVLIDRPTASFRIEFLVHVKGLSLSPVDAPGRSCWHVSDATGKVDWMITEPLVLDDNLEVLPVQGIVTHSLTDNGDGTFTYIKESVPGVDFSALPERFWVDASTVYSSTSDGCVENNYGAGWDGVRSATTGTAVNSWNDSLAQIFSVSYSSLYLFKRAYFYFDTSALSGASSATLYIHGVTNQSGSAIAQLGTQGSPLSKGDYDSFSGGAYNSAVAWSSSGWNAIAFNTTGVGDIDTSGVTKVCVRESHDFNNNSTTDPFLCGGYFADASGTDHDPYLSVTWDPTRFLAIDGAIQTSVTITSGVDALVEKQGVTPSAGVDAMVGIQVDSMKAGLDGLVGMGFDHVGLKADLVRRFYENSSIDSVVWKEPRATSGLSAILLRDASLSVRSDGLLRAVMGALSGVDALAVGSLSSVARISACVLCEDIPVATGLHGFTKAIHFSSFQADACVSLGTVPVPAFMNAAVTCPMVSTVGVDAISVYPMDSGLGLDAVLITESNTSAVLDSSLQSAGRPVVFMDGMLFVAPSMDLSSDAVLTASLDSPTMVDAVAVFSRLTQSGMDAGVRADRSLLSACSSCLQRDSFLDCGCDACCFSGYLEPVVMDAVVSADIPTASDMDACLISDSLSWTGLDAKPMVPVAVNGSVNALLERYPVIRSLSDACISTELVSSMLSDAVFSRVGEPSVQVDGSVESSFCASSGLTGYLLDGGGCGSFLDGLCSRTDSGGVSSDGILQGGNVSASSLDSVFPGNGALPVGMSSCIEAVESIYGLMDAVLETIIARRVSVNAILSGGTFSTMDFDSVVSGMRIPAGATANEILWSPPRKKQISAASRTRVVSSPIRIKTIYYQP